MCGATGEVRLDGQTPDITAVSAMAEAMAPRGPDAAGVWSQGRVALGHRRLKIIDLSEAGAQPMVDSDLGLAVALERLHLQLQGAAPRAERATATASSPTATPRSCSRPTTTGATASSTTSRACSPSRSSSATAAGCCSAATGSASSRCTSPRTPSRIRFASSLPALLAGGGVDTRIDPVALHHYLSFHSVVPPPRTILRGVSQGAARIAGRDRAGRHAHHDDVLGARLHAAATNAPTGPNATGRTPFSRRCGSPSSAAWSPTCRSGCLLSGGVDSSLIVGLLAEAGQHGLATFSIGFESVGGVAGRRVQVLRHHRRALRHRSPPDPHRHRPDAARTRRRDRRDERADGQPRLRRLLSAQPGGGQARQGGAVRAGRRRGVRRLPLVSADGSPTPTSLDGAVASYRKAFFDRDPGGVAALVTPRLPRRGRSQRAVRHRALRPRTAPRPASTGRCASTPP